MKKKSTFWKDFKAFITRGNVVDMAVGVAVATAFTAIVTAFTKGFISPILALISSNASLTEFKWVIREADEVAGTAEVAILWGAFLQAIMDFLIIAFVMFTLLRVVMLASKKASEVRQEVKDKLTNEDEIRAAKEKAEKEAAEKAQAEAAAAAEEAKKAAEEAARLAAEKAQADDAADHKLKDDIAKQTELLEKICQLLEKK